GVWPPLPDLQRGPRLQPRGAAHRGRHLDLVHAPGPHLRAAQARPRPAAGPAYRQRPGVPGRGLRAVGQAQRHAIRYIQPGKPNQHAYIERFNRTFREEVLDQHLFTRLDDVREAAYWWMLEYNEERPHDSLGDLTPAEYRQRVAGSSTFEMPA